MMMMHPRPALFFMLLAATLACGPRVANSGDDDDDEASAPEDLPPPTDLPCGGADLMTDNANCGTCGNECDLSKEGTEWEAGACVDGECGPIWSSCLPQQADPFETCADVCAVYDQTCVSGGCAGVAGIMVAVPWFGGCNLSEAEITPIATCDEQLQFFEDDETQSHVKCCCSIS